MEGVNGRSAAGYKSRRLFNTGRRTGVWRLNEWRCCQSNVNSSPLRGAGKGDVSASSVFHSAEAAKFLAI